MIDLHTAASVDRDLVEQAAALRPLLAGNAERCEQERRITDDNLAALDEAELFAVLAPKRWGGQGATLATQLAVAAELGRGCTSTAWVQTIYAVTAWAASLMVPEGQADVFSGARVPRVCGVVTASGTATPVDGGYRINGRWGFASGSLHADWGTCGVAVLDADGRPTGLDDVAYVPLAELSVDDTWFVAGMRGTGSNTLVADDVFVPTRRLAFTGHMAAPAPGSAGAAPDVGERAPSDGWPVGPTLALVLLGPMLGTVEAALDTVTAKAGSRGIAYTHYARQIDSSVVLTDIARAGLDLDTARMHVFRSAASLDAAAEAGDRLDDVGTARVRGACGYAGETLRRSMDTLVNVGGASSFADASTLQRNWRDLNVASRHAFLATGPVLEIYARALFGLDQITDLV